MMPPPNVRIESVRRATRATRHGDPLYDVVQEDFPAYAVFARRFVRTAGGDLVQVDGTLVLDPAADVRPGDVVTVDNDARDSYVVMGTTPGADITGQMRIVTFTLAKRPAGSP